MEDLGALVYHIRRCLHDYGDADSIDILQQISDAMAQDSRLLIVEQILSDPPSALGAAADMFMATIGGKERTLQNFHEIANAARSEDRAGLCSNPAPISPCWSVLKSNA